MLSGLYNIRIEGLLFIQPLYFDCNGMVVMNRTTCMLKSVLYYVTG